MDIVRWPNEVLNQVAQEVTVFDRVLSDLIDDMRAIMYANNGLGLAANQVNVLKQVVVLDTTSTGGKINQEFVNPSIVNAEGRQMYKEGCLSFPGVFINMPRYETVTVSAQDRDGRNFTITSHGVDAVCLQHELDHLAGLTFYDKMGPVKRAMYKNKFNKLKKRKR